VNFGAASTLVGVMTLNAPKTAAAQIPLKNVLFIDLLPVLFLYFKVYT